MNEFFRYLMTTLLVSRGFRYAKAIYNGNDNPLLYLAVPLCLISGILVFLSFSKNE